MHLDVECYEQSLRQVFSRHSILCTSFGKDDEGYHQRVNPIDQACVLEKHELGDVDDIDAAAMELMVSLSKQPMDVENGPLAVMHLIRIDDDHHIFFFLPHHLVFDGWSFDIFLRELGQFYESGVAGKALTLERTADSISRTIRHGSESAAQAARVRQPTTTGRASCSRRRRRSCGRVCRHPQRGRSSAP